MRTTVAALIAGLIVAGAGGAYAETSATDEASKDTLIPDVRHVHMDAEANITEITFNNDVVLEKSQLYQQGEAEESALSRIWRLPIQRPVATDPAGPMTVVLSFTEDPGLDCPTCGCSWYCGGRCCLWSAAVALPPEGADIYFHKGHISRIESTDGEVLKPDPNLTEQLFRKGTSDFSSYAVVGYGDGPTGPTKFGLIAP